MHLIFACALLRSFRWRFCNPFSSSFCLIFFLILLLFSFFFIFILSDYFAVVSHFMFALLFVCAIVISVVVLKFIFWFRFIMTNNNICCNCILYSFSSHSLSVSLCVALSHFFLPFILCGLLSNFSIATQIFLTFFVFIWQIYKMFHWKLLQNRR